MNREKVQYMRAYFFTVDLFFLLILNLAILRNQVLNVPFILILELIVTYIFKIAPKYLEG